MASMFVVLKIESAGSKNILQFISLILFFILPPFIKQKSNFKDKNEMLSSLNNYFYELIICSTKIINQKLKT